MTQALSAHAAQDNHNRLVKPAILKGALGRCPACGEGPLFRSYLKVNHDCSSCGEELHHQRADDGPAYLTIMIVAHVLTPFLMLIFVMYRPSPLLLTVVFSVAAVVMSLLLLPRIKGGFIGFQWARRMNGFGKGNNKG